MSLVTSLIDLCLHVMKKIECLMMSCRYACNKLSKQWLYTATDPESFVWWGIKKIRFLFLFTLVIIFYRVVPYQYSKRAPSA